jgi:hypothetical protein
LTRARGGSGSPRRVSRRHVAGARIAAEEPGGSQALASAAWLALGLLGAMASAGIVASFEDELAQQVLLAVFVPAVVYIADAVGTQPRPSCRIEAALGANGALAG